MKLNHEAVRTILKDLGHKFWMGREELDTLKEYLFSLDFRFESGDSSHSRLALSTIDDDRPIKMEDEA